MTPEQQDALDNVKKHAANVAVQFKKVVDSAVTTAKESPGAFALAIAGVVYAPWFVTALIVVSIASFDYAVKKVQK